MSIHPSHTCRYVIDLIKVLKLDIKYNDNLSKEDLFKETWNILDNLDDIDGSVEELEHIKNYLSYFILKMIVY